MKKVLSLVLSLIMAVCVLPAGVAFAAGSGAISAGQTATVTLDRDGDTYILHFTPERTEFITGLRARMVEIEEENMK